MIPAQLSTISVFPQRAVDIPLGYAIDKKTLRRLKNNTIAAPKGGVQPTLRQDPSVKTQVPAPLAPGLVTSFEGRDNGGQPDGFLHRPPDPTMAAGPNHIGTVVNSTINFYTKTGVPVLESSMSSWFASLAPPGGPFDPKIVYDAQAGHWMIIALATDNVSQAVYLLSVSQTTDPTGGWWNYKINNVTLQGGSAWGDYEDIGFDGNASGAVYISSNQFSFSAGFFTTTQLTTIAKSEVYSGAALTLFKTTGLTNSDGSKAFTIRPARSLSPTSAEYMINSRSGSGTSVTLWRVNPAFPAAPTITRQANVNIGFYTVAPNAKQPGCANTLDTIDSRIFNAVYKNGMLYAGFTERHNWGGGNVAAARFLKIDTASNTAVVNETYGADGLSYWFPAVTVDGAGNIISVFARSGVNEFAGIHYSGRLTTDSATQPSALLKAGAECITGSRWGDYFGISVDPVNNANVWVYGEWAKDVPGVSPIWDWGTWVGRVSFNVVSPPVTLALRPDKSSVARGGALGYWIHAVNTTASTQCIDYWENVTLPSGIIFPVTGELFGPVSACLSAGVVKNVHLTQPIPLFAPIGLYRYNAQLGAAYPTVDSAASFGFFVTP